MKRILISLLLLASLVVNAQNADKLKPYFTKLFYVDKANVYAGNDLAKDGEKYMSLTVKDIVDGTPLTWSSSEPRKSFLEKANGLSHNRNTPIFKKPVGDTPHLYFPNVLATQFISPKFPGKGSPNTCIALVRLRESVRWEGGVGMGVTLRDRDDHFELGNFAAAVQLDRGNCYTTRWAWIVLEDNGAKSRVIINLVQMGGFKTLPKSYIDALYYGTNSHIIEHDLKYCGWYNGIFTDAQLSEIFQISNKIVPIGSFPRKPIIYEPRIKVENGSYSLGSYKYYSYDGASIDPASVKCEWILIGKDGLDGQKHAFTGPVFTPPKADQQIAVIVSCRDAKGKYYSGVPFRSEFMRDDR